jgi:putative ATP-binding cassette transporter
LRQAITYPANVRDFTDEQIKGALARVGLPEFVNRLDDDDRWDRLMSLGQQQRLAFARVLLQKPRWVFLDEATAALDEENQLRVMSIFDDELAETAVVSIGHRPGLEAFHKRKLQLVGGPAGARLRRTAEPPSHTRRLRDIMRQILRDVRPTTRREPVREAGEEPIPDSHDEARPKRPAKEEERV